MARAKTTNGPKIAIIHDWMVGGGAEKVVEQLHKLYPSAPIYTSYCNDEWRSRLNGKVVTGYLQRWPFSKLRKFLPLLRMAWFSRLDLSEYDIIISSTGNGEAKFARATKKDARHICYCNTPPHFLWAKYDEYIENPSVRPKWLARIGLKLLVRPFRKLDYIAAQKVDVFIANSTHIKSSILKYYGKDSQVIHPPVDVEKFTSSGESTQKRSGFIMWGRHVPYKRFDIAVEACNKLGLPLTIVGEGPETPRLKQIAGPSVKFTGKVSDEELVELAHKAKYFIFPSEEDFGIAPVEAIAAGLYVIAYKGGGALDYINPGTNGTFFNNQSTTSLIKSIALLGEESTDRENLQQFSYDRFGSEVKSLINSSYL